MICRPLPLVLASLLIFEAATRAEGRRQESNTTFTPDKPPRQEAVRKLPPLPAGVEDLKFSEFFMPIGRYGLEYSEKLKSLNGKKVRILGYMIQNEVKSPGLFMLGPFPLEMSDGEEGMSDYLHPATLHVIMPENKDAPVPQTRGLMLLTGTLSVGPHDEADGRSSCARLLLDPPTRKPVAVRSPRGLSQISGSSAR